jgi:hypothetical protein
MEISQKKLKENYPFDVPSGWLECELSGKLMSDGTPIPHILFVGADGVRYALNGYARSSGLYRDYESIWRDHPGKRGQKVPVQRVMSLGLQVLKEKYPDVHQRIVG